MSNEPPDPPLPPVDAETFDRLFEGLDEPDNDPRDEQINELQGQIQTLDNKIHEERFGFILTGIILFDVYFLLDAENWAAPVVIGLLQLVGLVILAEKCRVKAVAPLVDKITGAFSKGQ